MKALRKWTSQLLLRLQSPDSRRLNPHQKIAKSPWGDLSGFQQLCCWPSALPMESTCIFATTHSIKGQDMKSMKMDFAVVAATSVAG